MRCHPTVRWTLGANAQGGRQIPAAMGCSLGRSYVCSASAERTFNFALASTEHRWTSVRLCRMVTKCCCTAVVWYPARIATISESTDSSHLHCLKVGNMTSCGTRHFSSYLLFWYCFLWHVSFCILDFVSLRHIVFMIVFTWSGYKPPHQSILQFATTEFSSENGRSSPTHSSGYEDSFLSIHACA